jgi:DtxR family Mn-dependent transcriptional regulator
MDAHESGSGPLSESVEMYLLRIALLQHNGQPVPAPLLAQELAISLVSANEMIRKLMDRGLVAYEPYKGVTLTDQGARLARRVLRCRRLWEVFFVAKLGIEPCKADEMACRFEHVTPDELAERLATFLEYPRFSPQNEPIPYDTLEPKEVLWN